MNKKIYLFVVTFALILASCTNKNDDNTTFDFENEKASITLSSESQYVTVSDDKTSAEVFFRSTGGQADVIISSEPSNWEFAAAEEWIVVEKKFDGINISAEANNGQELRTGHIIITTRATDGKESTAKIKVSQNAVYGSNISVDREIVNMTAGGSVEQVVNIESNNDRWDFSVNCSWLYVEKIDDELHLKALPNPNDYKRGTSVTVSAGNADNEKVTLYVTQDAKATLIVTKTRISLPDDNSTDSFTVTTNQPGGFAISAPASDWLTTSQDGNTITVNASSSFQETSRELVIKIIAGSGDNVCEKDLIVSQIGNDRSAMVLKYTTDAPNTQVVFPAGEDTNCTIDWGDGKTSTAMAAYPVHIFELPGDYYVSAKGTITNMTIKDPGAPYARFITGVQRWGKTGLTSMSYALANSKVTSLPADKDESFAEVENFEFAFFGLSELTTIHKDLFKYAVKATSLEKLFTSCENLASIPAGLFDNCTEVTNFFGAFQALTSLTGIPVGLFKNQTKVTDASSVFQGATSIVAIPNGLFNAFVEVTTLSRAFYGCTSLKTIPVGLFDKATKVVHLSYVFYNCSSLTAIPAGLFKKNTTAYSYQSAFENCSTLTTIPGDIFFTEGATFPPTIVNPSFSTQGFDKTFMGCTGLTTIPATLFDNVPLASVFKETFKGCSSLTTIPVGLFDKSVAATSFNNTFYQCTSLTSLPIALFDKNTEATNFVGTFFGCTSLTGETPKYINGPTTIRLWERDGTNGFKRASGMGCFRNCNGLNDYGTIPSNWK